MASSFVPTICIAYGDGAARLMTDCVLKLLRAVGTHASYHMIEIGNEAYRRGHVSGIGEKDLESVKSADAVLQAPSYLGLRKRPLLPPLQDEANAVVAFPFDGAKSAYGLPYSPYIGAEAVIGNGYALFCMAEPEKIQPLYAESVDPSGLILAACLMLSYLKRQNEAFLLQAAFMRALEEGAHPYGLYRPGVSAQCLNADEFTAAIIEFIGKTPRRFRVVNTEQPFLALKEAVK